MPTIPQLPPADTISASDLIPISQGGSVHSASVGALLAQTQPAIIVGPPSLLGRFSIGSGGPDTIAIGDGLTLNSGTLSSSSFDIGSLPLQTSLAPNDQIVVTNAGSSQLVGINRLRELFTAGPNITIDETGLISASIVDAASTYSLAALSPVTTMASTDLVGVCQGGSDHTITYESLLDGLTIDLAPPASPVSESDTFWVAQLNNVMARQTLGALWTWISGKLAAWMRPVIELDVDTTFDDGRHNNAILLCSQPISVSAIAANLTSGFSCELINASLGPITFSDSILTSNGSTGLSPYQCATVRCVKYSVGATVFASVSTTGSATFAPGQVFGLVASSTTSGSTVLSWSAPTSGGEVSVYLIHYRITGTISWLLAGQNNGALRFTVSGLQVSTNYDFAIGTANNIGPGPISSALTVMTLTS